MDAYELVLGARIRLVGGVKVKGEEEQKLSISPGFEVWWEVCWEEESEVPFPERLTNGHGANILIVFSWSCVSRINGRSPSRKRHWM